METIPAKTILTRGKNTSWFGYDYNMNLYKGCNHGCIYCDSRSDCYGVQDFSKVRAKENALEIIRNELSKRRLTGVVATGAMSDPYNPYEKTEKLTRNALELINAYGFGAAIATKSDLVTRDIDILKDIASVSPVICKITITSADDETSSLIEPGVSVSSKRFTAIESLRNAGIFAGILMMPILPLINDTEQNITAIVNRAAECGANFIYPAFGLTMRSGQREYMYSQFDKLMPERSLTSKYKSMFGNRYYCSSRKAKELNNIFINKCNEYGILYKMQDIIRGYRQGYTKQLSFY